jgi:gamma-glutamyl hercynylcysteine S-oxide hydrolase
MCRHLAWLGAPRPLAQFVTEPSHSLVRQSYAATELLRGSVCADGFGLGWYPDDEAAPARYRRSEPIWADADLGRFAEAVRSRAIIAAVRNGTPGIPGGVASTQPVAARGLLASHNGYIADFHRRARRLREDLPDDLYAALTGQSDSETFLLLAIHHVRRDGDLAAGLASAVDAVLRIAPGSSLCVVMTDGRSLVAARMADDQPCDSLYVHRRPDGVVVASEPLDLADGWLAMPEQAVTAIAGPTVALDGAVS